MTKSIFITGGRGFIGRNLAEKLPGDYVIHAPGRAELDLLDEHAVLDYLRAHAFDTVIHCATHNGSRNPTGDITKVLPNNLRMFANLLRARDYFDRLIFLGSGSEYDMRHYQPLMSEDYFGKHVPADDTGFSKYLMHRLAERDPKCLNLRLFGVFGPHEDWEIRFISNACCKAVFDRPITIKQNVRFDYLWIDDLVRVVDWFLRNPAAATRTDYNVCTSDVIDLVSLAEMVREISGKDLEIRVAEPGFKREYSGDNRRMLELMGDFRFTDRREAITQLYRWYEANRALIDPAKLEVDK